MYALWSNIRLWLKSTTYKTIYLSSNWDCCTIKFYLQNPDFFLKKIKNNRIKPEDFLYRWPQYFSFLAQHASETGTTHYSHLISSQKAVTNRNQQPGMFYLTAKNSGYSSVSPDTRSHIGKKWSVMTVEKQTVWNCSYPPKIKPQLWAPLRL